MALWDLLNKYIFQPQLTRQRSILYILIHGAKIKLKNFTLSVGKYISSILIGSRVSITSQYTFVRPHMENECV